MLFTENLKVDNLEINISEREIQQGKINILLKKSKTTHKNISGFPFEIFKEKNKLVMRGNNWELVREKSGFYHFLYSSKRPPKIGVHNSLMLVIAVESPPLSGILLHSSSAVYNRKGVCFVGKSGSGKTTIIKNLKLLTPLHDDMNILFIRDKVLLYPFPSQTISSGVILKSIFLLKKGKKVAIKKLSKERAIAELIACAPFVHFLPQTLEHILKLVELLVEKTRVYELYFSFEDVGEEKIIALTENE